MACDKGLHSLHKKRGNFFLNWNEKNHKNKLYQTPLMDSSYQDRSLWHKWVKGIYHFAITTITGLKSKSRTIVEPKAYIFGWLFLGLTSFWDSISVYIGPSPKERQKEDPFRAYCKCKRHLPYYHPNCRTPRHWKFTQDQRTTRSSPKAYRFI